jgi:serine/threonine protein kinase
MNDEKKRDGYVIEGRIAEGAFGTVFKATRISDCEESHIDNFTISFPYFLLLFMYSISILEKVVAIKDLFFSSNKKSK